MSNNASLSYKIMQPYTLPAEYSFFKMTPQELDEALCTWAHKAYIRDDEYAIALEAYERKDDELDMLLEDIIYELKEAAKNAGEKMTEAEATRQAMRTDKYKEYKKLMEDAREKAKSLRVRRDACARFFDTCRSILSSKNNQMKFNV